MKKGTLNQPQTGPLTPSEARRFELRKKIFMILDGVSLGEDLLKVADRILDLLPEAKSSASDRQIDSVQALHSLAFLKLYRLVDHLINELRDYFTDKTRDDLYLMALEIRSLSCPDSAAHLDTLDSKSRDILLARLESTNAIHLQDLRGSSPGSHRMTRLTGRPNAELLAETVGSPLDLEKEGAQESSQNQSGERGAA